MAALDFPASPTDGQIFNGGNGMSYRWSSAKGLWIVQPGSAVATPTYDVMNSLMSDPNTLGNQAADTPLPITAGQQVFLRTFQALDPTHPIEVDVQANMGLPAAGAWIALMLYIDGAIPAVAQSINTINASWMNPTRLFWRGVLPPGPHTFMLRFGCNGTTGYLNGSDGVRHGGGAAFTSMKISEVGIGIQGPPGAPGPPGVSSPILAYHYKETTARTILTGTWSSTSVTPPTNTVGVAIDSITFTPQSASSVFEIEANFRGCCGSSDFWNVFCFNGTVCVENMQTYVYNYNTPLPVLKTILPSVSLAPITLAFRLGSNSGTSYYLNAAQGPVYPPNVRSWMMVREYLAS
jgi:hypothetical protein